MQLGWCGRSKRRRDVAIRPAGQTFIVTNDEVGIKELTKELKRWSPQLINIGSYRRSRVRRGL